MQTRKRERVSLWMDCWEHTSTDFFYYNLCSQFWRFLLCVFLSYLRVISREYSICVATDAEKRRLVEEMRCAIHTLLLRRHRGLGPRNDFVLQLPADLRVFNAIFWPGPSSEDIDWRFGRRLYDEEDSPPAYFPVGWDVFYVR